MAQLQRSVLRPQFQRKFDVHSEVQVATCEDQLSISTSEECFAYMSGEQRLRVKIITRDSQRGLNSSQDGLMIRASVEGCPGLM